MGNALAMLGLWFIVGAGALGVPANVLVGSIIMLIGVVLMFFHK